LNSSATLALVSISITIASACAHPARPTITGRELYAQIPALRDTGQATIGPVSIRKSHVLTTVPEGQVFLVEQVIDQCQGGDPEHDVACTLALLLDQRFSVSDRLPKRREVGRAREDRSGSMLTAAVVVGVGVAAVGGLVYGVATCDFPGCKAVFGVPLVFIGGAALFALGRD
jgi:hypothetical protein